MNLPGVRQSRYMDDKVYYEPDKTWSLMATCKDGFVMMLTAQDIENEKK